MKCFAIATITLLLAISYARLAVADEPAAPAESTDPAEIARLIEQLGSTDSASAIAQQELIKRGFEAFDALTDAEENDDPEIATQAAYLVRMIRSEWTRDDDPRASSKFSRTMTFSPTNAACCALSSLRICQTIRDSRGFAAWCDSRSRLCSRSKRHYSS